MLIGMLNFFLFQDIQLDLIGFVRPVAISEIRVIPKGCKVHPEINDRLGYRICINSYFKTNTKY